MNNAESLKAISRIIYLAYFTMRKRVGLKATF